MQIRFVAVALALVAGVAAHGNETHPNTTTSLPTPTPTENAAWTNAVSFGGLALAMAGVVAAAF